VALEFLDEGRVETLQPPDYAFVWDTAWAAEGSHRLRATATAGTRTYLSPEIVVVVDRTEQGYEHSVNEVVQFVPLKSGLIG